MTGYTPIFHENSPLNIRKRFCRASKKEQERIRSCFKEIEGKGKSALGGCSHHPRNNDVLLFKCGPYLLQIRVNPHWRIFYFRKIRSDQGNLALTQLV